MPQKAMTTLQLKIRRRPLQNISAPMAFMKISPSTQKMVIFYCLRSGFILISNLRKTIDGTEKGTVNSFSQIHS